MLKTKTWILIFAVIFLVCGALCLFLLARSPEGQVVQILQDGVCIREIDLSKVTAPYTLEISGHGGTNTVQVIPGGIRILKADCPDQVCVHRGWLRDSAAPIVCLPHHLTIQMIGSAAVDGVAE